MIPFEDWQFWVATILAFGGLVAIVRPLLPSKRRANSCPSCPSNTPKQATNHHAATLTIDGKSIQQ